MSSLPPSPALFLSSTVPPSVPPSFFRSASTFLSVCDGRDSSICLACSESPSTRRLRLVTLQAGVGVCGEPTVTKRAEDRKHMTGSGGRQQLAPLTSCQTTPTQNVVNLQVTSHTAALMPFANLGDCHRPPAVQLPVSLSLSVSLSPC